jgi:hypothetical protein
VCRWSGYDDECNSWEPEHGLHPDLVAEYQLRLSSPAKKQKLARGCSASGGIGCSEVGDRITTGRPTAAAPLQTEAPDSVGRQPQPVQLASALVAGCSLVERQRPSSPFLRQRFVGGGTTAAADAICFVATDVQEDRRGTDMREVLAVDSDDDPDLDLSEVLQAKTVVDACVLERQRAVERQARQGAENAYLVPVAAGSGQRRLDDATTTADASDELQAMLAAKMSQAQASEEMRDRVRRDVAARMDNGVHLSPTPQRLLCDWSQPAPSPMLPGAALASVNLGATGGPRDTVISAGFSNAADAGGLTDQVPCSDAPAILARPMARAAAGARPAPGVDVTQLVHVRGSAHAKRQTVFLLARLVHLMSRWSGEAAFSQMLDELEGADLTYELVLATGLGLKVRSFQRRLKQDRKFALSRRAKELMVCWSQRLRPGL